MNLPEELLTEILVNLPVDSSVRLSCVCKAWRDLIIGNPYFAEKQLKKNKKEDPLMFIRSYHEKISKIEDVVISCSKRKRLLSCPPNSDPYMKTIGSCNGIVCLVEYGCGNRGEFHLYNPITREEVKLPRHNLDKLIDMSFGFGVDACNKDYRVVAIGKNEVEIYKRSTKCWSKVCVEDEIRDVMNGRMKGVGVVNGFYHWWISSGQTILTFDFETEMFGTIQPPDVCNRCNLRMGVLDDSLAICFTNIQAVACGMDIELWVMTEYGNDKSWTKKISTYLPDAFLVDSIWPVHGTNRLILPGYYFANLDHHPTSIAEEGQQDATTTLIPIDDSLTDAAFTNCVYFQPSLVSLGSPSL